MHRFNTSTCFHPVESCSIRMQPLVILAVEHGVGNESAGVDGVLGVALTDNGQWVAGSSAQFRHSTGSSRELLGINTLDIATMVLIKVREAVIDKDGLLHSVGDGELDCAFCCLPCCVLTSLIRRHRLERWGLHLVYIAGETGRIRVQRNLDIVWSCILALRIIDDNLCDLCVCIVKE